MTGLSQVQRKNTTFTVAGVALAALMIGGIAGNRVEAFVQGAAADAARAAAAEQAKWEAYGEEWEARYRQMYPLSR